MSSRTLNSSQMSSQVDVIPGAISEIFATASETGLLTLSDRYGLMAATLNDAFNEEEAQAVNRLLRAVRRGRVKMSRDKN